MPRKARAEERRQLPKPRSLEDWAKNGQRRDDLADLLSNPVLQEAFETLEAAYSPSIPSYIANDGGSVIPDGANLNNLLALRHAHRAGYFGFANALRNLTRDKVLRRVERSPWGDLVATD